MAKTAEHWYPWFHGQWFGSTTRADMSLAARGAYRDLLDLCAANGAIPADRNKLARMLLCERAELDEIWDEILPNFVAENGSEKLLYNEKMRRVTEQQARKRKLLKANGKKGAEKRWLGHGKLPLASSDGKVPLAGGNGNKEEKRRDIDNTPLPPSFPEPTKPTAGAFDTTDGPPLPEKTTDTQFRRLVAIYPKATHIAQATDAWRQIVGNSPEPVREANRVLDAARVIDSTMIEKRYLPNLATFIREKRYLEDWRAAANDTAQSDPLPFVPPWETK
jgi:hypothetical protein